MKRIVIIGAGFAGLAAAKPLSQANADILVIDRANHNLFQPLLYQVATTVLSAAQIASPIRGLLKNQRNTTVFLGEVSGINKDAKFVYVSNEDHKGTALGYDILVIATGVTHSYFGHDEFAEFAPGLKDIGDTASLEREGKPLPDVAQVAIQQGRYAGRRIAKSLLGRPCPEPFRYFDKGNMAVIGAGFAILQAGRLRLSGIVAWLAWAGIHLQFLSTTSLRVSVLLRWMWSFLTGQTGVRLIENRSVE